MKEHELKTIPPFFQEVLDGIKTFKIRQTMMPDMCTVERDFEVGDVLFLREYDYYETLKQGRTYTGRECRKLVTYILDDTDYGLQEGFVIMALSDIPRELNLKETSKCLTSPPKKKARTRRPACSRKFSASPSRTASLSRQTTPSRTR